ncbi:hypothetical protein [Belnapia arida]|nr:hypothetical protein [Belnapia arida]
MDLDLLALKRALGRLLSRAAVEADWHAIAVPTDDEDEVGSVI